MNRTPKHTSEQLKEKGNKCFKDGEYEEAEKLYTYAIQQNSTNPILWTNRANARLKLGRWHDVMDDCIKSIELQRENLKAYYFLGSCYQAMESWAKRTDGQPAQAQFELQHPNEALTSAITAYDICAHSKTQTSNAFAIAQFVLKCKKAKWDLRERERLRRRNALLREFEMKLESDEATELDEIRDRVADGNLGEVGANEESAEVKAAYAAKITELRNAFAASDPAQLEKREVPEYLVDPISFEIMHDPVITKSGHSYERATIVEHLKRNPTDPLSRQPLTIGELRNNVNLKKACDEFWEAAKGWAWEW